MDKKHIIQRQGKDFILYEGLLSEAHEQGLKRISTTLIQIPHEDNGNMAIVQAEVETDKGVFSGLADAAPFNVSKQMVPVLLRLAETRAKARALRDATNIDVTAFEELGDAGEEPLEDGRSVNTKTGEVSEGNVRTFPNTALKGDASANQLAVIAKLRRQLGHEAQDDDGLTAAQAGEIITELQKTMNAQRKERPAQRAVGGDEAAEV